MHKAEYNIKAYHSARSGRAYKVILAPPILIFAVFGISTILQIPAGYVIHNFSFTLGMLLNQLGTLLIPVIVAIRVFGLTGREVLPFKKIGVAQIILAVVMMFSMAIVTDYLLYITEWIVPVSERLEEKYEKLMFVDSVGLYFYKLVFLCVLPSICEEVFFRGFCQTGLERYYGKKTGILLTAAIFSIAHLNPWYIHLYFLLGVLLGWLFATSGSLWIPILCHVANNFWTLTTHATGDNMPITGDFAWMNMPVFVVALGILILGIYGWGYIIKNKYKFSVVM